MWSRLLSHLGSGGGIAAAFAVPALAAGAVAGFPSAAASPTASVTAPASGLTATATSAAGTLSYQGTSVDRGVSVLVFTSDDLTLDGLQILTPCQPSGTTGPTATEATGSTALQLQGSTSSPARFLLTSLDASGLGAPFTVANPPAAGYVLTAPTDLAFSATLIEAAQASGQTSEVAVIC